MNQTDKITVKYQIKKECCSCCGREFEEEQQLSDFKEFNISLSNLLTWTNWKEEFTEPEDYVREIIEEFVFETITFYALSSNENLYVPKAEQDRVTEIILAYLKQRY